MSIKKVSSENKGYGERSSREESSSTVSNERGEKCKAKNAWTSLVRSCSPLSSSRALPRPALEASLKTDCTVEPSAQFAAAFLNESTLDSHSINAILFCFLSPLNNTFLISPSSWELHRLGCSTLCNSIQAVQIFLSFRRGLNIYCLEPYDTLLPSRKQQKRRRG